MATFNKRTWVNNSAPYLNADNLNGLENDIQTFGDAIVTELTQEINEVEGYLIDSNEIVSYDVTESTQIFALPNNVDDYTDTSFCIICEIDGTETTDYTLNEQALQPVLILDTAISTGTVTIRAIKFKQSFINFILNNTSVG